MDRLDRQVCHSSNHCTYWTYRHTWIIQIPALHAAPDDTHILPTQCPSPQRTCYIFLHALAEVHCVYRAVRTDFLIYFRLVLKVYRDSSVGIASLHGLDSPGIESRWEVRFSAPVLTGPGTHPAFYATCIGSFPEVKRQGPGVDHPFHLVPRLKK